MSVLVCLLCYQLGSYDLYFEVPDHNYGKIKDFVKPVKAVAKAKPMSARFTFAPKPHESIIFVGDVMLARNLEFLMQSKGGDYPFTGLSFKTLGLNPFVVGNFEASVPDLHQPTPPRQLKFSVPTSSLGFLLRAGFTHLSLANNHSYDFGASGFLSTTRSLENADLIVFGHPKRLSKDSVTFLTVNNTVIAIIGIHALEKLPTQAEVESVLEFASKRSNYQFVYIHWGNEYETVHNNIQKKFAKGLVQAGVDLIVGHHPHVVQDVDLIDGVPVFYSLGNYIFDQYFSSEVQNGLLLHLSFSMSPTISLIPVSTVNNLSQPSLVSNKQHATVLRNLAKRSHPDLAKYIVQGSLPLDIQVATSSKIAMMNQ